MKSILTLAAVATTLAFALPVAANAETVGKVVVGGPAGLVVRVADRDDHCHLVRHVWWRYGRRHVEFNRVCR